MANDQPIALLGYSVETMEAATELGIPFIAVVPSAFVPGLEKDGIATEGWNFDLRNEESGRLSEKLRERGVRVAVPLYEETVEWAGAVNGALRDDPRSFQRSLLFRDKAMMKRNAQMNGIRVGVFEEVASRQDALRFFERVNRALLKSDDVTDPVHLKPLSAAGSVGHVVIGGAGDIERLPDDAFPCLAESHISGQEFSVEAFVHDGKIRFMNVTEYVHLGYSQIVPASPVLETHRARIKAAVEKLIRAFQVEYGVIHPEYFIDADGDLNFGEVAARVPGGHIFELIGTAHEVNAYGAYLLCADPDASEERIEAYFARAQEGPVRYAANLMVYPRRAQVHELQIPKELLEHPYFERHDMFEPVTTKVAERVGFGNHYGTIYFSGEDPEVLRDLLERYEDYEFYV